MSGVKERPDEEIKDSNNLRYESNGFDQSQFIALVKNHPETRKHLSNYHAKSRKGHAEAEELV